jgi:hypothetical protein
MESSPNPLQASQLPPGVPLHSEACASTFATGRAVCDEEISSRSPTSGPPFGPHNGNAAYVEVLVAAIQPTYFMRIFGINSQTVTARAVATNLSGGNNSACLYTLGEPSKSIGVDINGNPTLNAPNCGIVDNGNYDPKGKALTINAGTFGVAGTNTGNSGSTGITCNDQSQSNCPAYGVPAAANPYASLTPPCSPCSAGTAANPVNNTFSPGTYSSISVGTGNFTFNPGIYIVDGTAAQGGLSIGANATVTGTGVMFYFTNGATVGTVGTPNITLTAPSPSNCPACPAQYDGILMYQDATDTNTGIGSCPPAGAQKGPELGGNSGSSFNGVLYFPGAQLHLYGNSGTINFATNVSDSLCMSGNATFNLLGNAGLPPGANVITNAVLVE